MTKATYEEVLSIAQQLTREEQDRLIGDLEDAANRATYDTANTAREDALPRSEAQERGGTGSTGDALNDPQPYTSPR